MKTKLLLICLSCFIAAGPAALGQETNGHGILGFLDPNTGAFRPVPPAAETDNEAAAATTVGGTVTLTITISVKTTSLTKFTCTASLTATDGTTSPVFFEETNTVAATGTGATRTCKLTIPYSWSLATQASDNMSTSYTVVGITGTGLPQRTSARQPLDVRKVPANGATTTLTAAVTS
jgi:hypothetical protein